MSSLIFVHPAKQDKQLSRVLENLNSSKDQYNPFQGPVEPCFLDLDSPHKYDFVVHALIQAEKTSSMTQAGIHQYFSRHFWTLISQFDVGFSAFKIQPFNFEKYGLTERQVV